MYTNYICCNVGIYQDRQGRTRQEATNKHCDRDGIDGDNDDDDDGGGWWSMVRSQISVIVHSISIIDRIFNIYNGFHRKQNDRYQCMYLLFAQKWVIFRYIHLRAYC